MQFCIVRIFTRLAVHAIPGGQELLARSPSKQAPNDVRNFALNSPNLDTFLLVARGNGSLQKGVREGERGEDGGRAEGLLASTAAP